MDPALATAAANLALLHLSQGRVDDALAGYARAIDIDPFFGPAHANLAALLHRLERRDEALFHARTAVELLPEDADIALNLSILEREAGSLDTAASRLAALATAHPGRVDVVVEQARLARVRDDRPEERRLLDHALALAPGHLPARRDLTQHLLERGDGEAALALTEESDALGGEEIVDHYLAGRALTLVGRAGDALPRFERAHALDPARAEPRHALAGALHDLGRHDAALAHLDILLAACPGMVEALVTRGNCLAALDQREAAVNSFSAALEVRPDLYVARYNRAHALRALGRLDQAETAFAEILREGPARVEVLNGLGVVAQERNDHAAALGHFDAALAVDAGFGDALNNKAISLQQLGRPGEAARAYARYLEEHPGRAEVYFNLGGLLQTLERWDESITVLRQGLMLDPGCRDIYPYLLHAQMQQCDWENLDALLATVQRITETQLAKGGKVSFTPFALQSLPVDIPLDLRRRVAERISTRLADVAGIAPRPHPRSRPARRSRGDKLRIGYVSPDFRGHSVAVAFQGIVEHHDTTRFSLHGFALPGGRPDAMTAYFRQAFDSFDDIAALPHDAAAKLIEDREIDILVDLAGHTRGTRLELFAYRPAPISAHYLGYSATVGAPYIDYLITDPRQLSPGAEAHFTEALVQLPDSFMAARPADISERRYSRAELGLPEDAIVFANFNKHYKHEPRMFARVMRLLKRLPGSVYWLKGGTVRSVENLRREAAARGIDPGRLIIAPNWPHGEHLARLRLADLALDNLYHGGGVTTVDALQVGLPVLSIAGETPQSRNGASLLHAIGLPELVVTDLDAFERLALTLARDPAALADLRGRLLANRRSAPLFDIARLTRYLERGYEMMWERHARGEKIDGFEVPAEPRV